MEFNPKILLFWGTDHFTPVMLNVDNEGYGTMALTTAVAEVRTGACFVLSKDFYKFHNNLKLLLYPINDIDPGFKSAEMTFPLTRATKTIFKNLDIPLDKKRLIVRTTSIVEDKSFDPETISHCITLYNAILMGNLTDI